MRAVLYGNGSSGNHGCEALKVATNHILNNLGISCVNATTSIDNEIYDVPGQEYTYVLYSNEKTRTLKQILICTIVQKLLKKRIEKGEYDLKAILAELDQSDIALSLGGDNYCYEDYAWLSLQNSYCKERGIKSVLWGCSVDPEKLKDGLIADLKNYSLIIARETLTYDALISAGVDKNTKLYPDCAFTLETKLEPLPYGFAENNTVGINLSPLIFKYEKQSGAAVNNFKKLIQHIIHTTDFQIALIPHVVSPANNDDRKILTKLYYEFKHTGRVVLIGDYCCTELKGYISRCRMFIGARTHATIAAYSTCVPTLAVGYSVKARGIAKDIFGSYDNYVLPVQKLKDENDLVNAFEWLKANEGAMRAHLQGVMPSYIEKARLAGKEIKQLTEGTEG